MQRYKNSKEAGVSAFEIGDDYIKAEFQNGPTYLYTYESAGKNNIEQMKKLAIIGRGLTTFINQNVKHHYAEKLR